MKRVTRILTVVLAIALLSNAADGNMDYVCASSTDGTEQEKPESEMTEEEKAAKEAKEAYEREVQATYELPVQTNEIKGWPAGPGTYGDAAIVMDADSGAILYAKNIDNKEYPASITKVLTALLAFQYGDMGSQITISDQALACLGSGYASIGLKSGNVITMEQAIYAMLLASANEASYAVGEAIAAGQGQDYEWFLNQMNEMCTQLGGKNSNFVNTNGVFDENHYTCARDMALIGKALFDYPEFFEICQTQQYVIPATETVEEHVFQQKHHMLLQGNTDYYQYAIGGKTGYTTEAENTLITMADNGERRLVCVVLKTYGGHPYSDTRALLDYGFQNFQKVSVEGYNDEFEYMEEEPYVLIPEEVDLKELEYKVEKADEESEEATVTYCYEDNPVGSYKVMLSKDYKEKKVSVADKKEVSKEESEEGIDKYKPLIAIGIVMILLVCVVISIIVTKISRRRKRKRRRRRR